MQIFVTEPIRIIATQYVNNHRVALLGRTLDDQPFAVFTINLPDEQIGMDEVVIKTYSEGETFRYLDVLQAAGIVSAPVRYVQAGFADVPVVKLLKLPEEINA